MNEIIRTYNKKNIRIRIIKNEVYFCIADIGKILELKDIHRQARRLKRGVLTSPTLTDGGLQNILYCNEPNLYRLIFKSKKIEAKRFQDWIFEEVLPSIRKTGKYSIPESLKTRSIKSRNLLTDEWQAHGIKKPYEYIQLTLQEYKALQIENGKRKKDFDRGELLLLNALESMEMLNLFYNPEIEGFVECKKSLTDTGAKVIEYKENKKIGVKNDRE